MLDVTSSKPNRALSIAEKDVESRKKIAGLEPADIARVVSLKGLIERRVDHYTEIFFAHLTKIGAAPELFARRGTLDQAKQRKREHLLGMVSGKYDRRYVEQRIELAMLYADHGWTPPPSSPRIISCCKPSPAMSWPNPRPIHGTHSKSTCRSPKSAALTSPS
jgi:rsbT co-antagonist protein RsbR